MEDKYEFDIVMLATILAMLDKNNIKGKEEYESERSKDTTVVDKESERQINYERLF